MGQKITYFFASYVKVHRRGSEFTRRQETFVRFDGNMDDSECKRIERPKYPIPKVLSFFLLAVPVNLD